MKAKEKSPQGNGENKRQQILMDAKEIRKIDNAEEMAGLLASGEWLAIDSCKNEKPLFILIKV